MDKATYRLNEAMIDIARTAQHLIDYRGPYGIQDEIDSKELASLIMDWAQEFEELHKDADFGDFDKFPAGYYGAVDDFTEAKMKERFPAPADDSSRRYAVSFELCGNIGVNASSRDEAREMVGEMPVLDLVAHLGSREVPSVTDMETQETTCY